MILIRFERVPFRWVLARIFHRFGKHSYCCKDWAFCATSCYWPEFLGDTVNHIGVYFGDTQYYFDDAKRLRSREVERTIPWHLDRRARWGAP